MAGLEAYDSEHSLRPKPKPKRKPRKKKPTYVEKRCSYCDVKITLKPRHIRTVDSPIKGEEVKQDEFACRDCWTMFERDAYPMGGKPRDARLRNERFAKLENGEYVMILRNTSYGGDSGMVHLEMGDVFKATRIGLPDGGASNKDRTILWATVDIQIGNETVRLFAEDFGTIKYLTLMLYMREGEYEPAYPTDLPEDAGYFRPTLPTRIQIQRAYGDDDLADKLTAQHNGEPMISKATEKTTETPEEGAPLVKVEVVRAGSVNRFRIKHGASVVAVSKDYQQTDSVLKALRAIKSRLKKRKVLTHPSGSVYVKVAAANGAIVMESVLYKTEEEATQICENLQAHLDDKCEVTMPSGKVVVL